MKIGKSKMLVAACGLALALTGGAHADTVIFSDNFDGENSGNGTKRYTGFDNWTVDRGSVDLFGNGTFDSLPGNGLYVELVGGSVGSISKTGGLDLGPGTYELSFDLAGSQRVSSTEKVNVNFGGEVAEFTRTQNQGFLTETITLELADFTNVLLSFGQSSSNDMIGALLDNVMITMINGTDHHDVPSVSVAPTPVAAFSGLILLGTLAVRRRRRA